MTAGIITNYPDMISVVSSQWSVAKKDTYKPPTLVMGLGLTHQVRNVGAIHELPLRKIKAFTAFLRKSWGIRPVQKQLTLTGDATSVANASYSWGRCSTWGNPCVPVTGSPRPYWLTTDTRSTINRHCCNALVMNGAIALIQQVKF